jgi:hypothetical protein
MTIIDTIFLIGDFLVAMGLVVGFKWALNHRKLSLYYYKLFWIGSLIGATWEFTFLLLGPEFLHSAVEWPFGLDGWPRKISHSIWDGGLFMVGVWLCLRWVKGRHFTKFNWQELSIMVVWGLGQELLVEYLFNGRVWIYEPLPWNPIIIPPIPGSSTDVGYTLIPQAVWVVAPIVFYLICIKTKDNVD